MLIPLEKFLSFLFSGAFSLTHNYGLSLLALSVMVNLILLPVYLPLEKWKKKKADEQAPMKKELEAIKRAYKGRERYFYTRAVHRRHKYNTLESVVLSLGLLIQIPFFLAAYHMLSHYEALNGVSFWFISNLGKPDAALHLAGIPINVLPLIMTGLNILSAFLYTRESAERKPLWVLAAVFLVLLYRSPAGLVLYWTANNVFALIKQIPEIPGRLKETKWEKVHAIIPNTGKWVYYLIPLFAIYLSIVSLFYPAVADKSKIILPATVMILLFLQEVVHFAMLILSKGSGRKRRIVVAAALFVFILYQARFGLSFIPEFVRSGLQRLSSAGVFKQKIAHFTIQAGLGLLITFPFVYKSVLWSSRRLSPGFSFQRTGMFAGWEEIFLSSVYIAGAWLLWIPVMIYSSLPEQFHFSAGEMLKGNILPFVLTVVLITGVSLLTPKRWRVIPWIITTSAAVAVFLYAFIIPFNFGFLTGFSLSGSDTLQGNLIDYLVDFLLLAALVALMSAGAEKGRKRVLSLLLVLNILIIGQGGFALAHSAAPLISRKNTGTAQQKSDGNEKLTVPLSADKDNVVVFMMDMMTGGYIYEILKENPDLKAKLDGFTWFPNTMSVGCNTVAAQPAIMGGPEFSPYEVNRRSLQHSVKKEVGRSYQVLIDNAEKAGLDVTLVDPFAYGELENEWPPLKSEKITVHTIDDYIGNLEAPYLADAKVSNGSALNKKLLRAIALFRTMPYGLKSFIYENGFWRPLNGVLIYQNYFEEVLPQWLFMKKLPDMTVGKQIKGQYYFIDSLLAHHPHAISKDGKLLSDRFPDPTVSDNRNGKNAYYAAEWSLKIIADWCADLKKKGLYDNTKIIIVSDHGNYRSADNAAPVKNESKLSSIGLNRVDHTSFNSTLLFKDFNKSGSLKIDKENMSNADTGKLSFTPDATEWVKSLDPHRTVTGQLTHAWDLREQTGTKYESFGVYQVSGDFYDVANWKKIGE